MNNLIVVNQDKLELVEEGLKQIKKFQKAKLQLDLMEEELKKMFKEKMEETGIDKYESPDKTFKVTYVGESVVNTFDSKKFKEENPEEYEKYKKTTTRKAYVKLS